MFCVSSWESLALFSTDNRFEISESISLLLQNLPLLNSKTLSTVLIAKDEIKGTQEKFQYHGVEIYMTFRANLSNGTTRKKPNLIYYY